MYDLRDLTTAEHPDRPLVALDTDLGQIAVLLDADAADDLAEVLAQVGADSDYSPTHRAEADAEVDPDRWLPVLVELVVAAQQARAITTRPLTLVLSKPHIVDAATGQPAARPATPLDEMARLGRAGRR